MTVKEAIALLQSRVDLIKKEYPDIWNDWGEGEALEMAIEALNHIADDSKKVSSSCGQENDKSSRHGAIDARRYTFGNDEFSLEAAYHDCKLVFDGITDDDSFQEADTGLILYYANEIIYALHEALDKRTIKRTETHACDCIERQAAIDAHCELCGDRGRCNCDICPDVEVFQLLPSAQPEIIRCRDCKWHGFYSCELHGNDWMRDGNGFCDRAERQEE